MEIKKRLYTVDDFWEMQFERGELDKHYELLDGEIVDFPPGTWFQGLLMAELLGRLCDPTDDNDPGIALARVGVYSPKDMHTLLGPDVAYFLKSRLENQIPGEVHSRNAGSRSGKSWLLGTA